MYVQTNCKEYILFSFAFPFDSMLGPMLYVSLNKFEFYHSHFR